MTYAKEDALECLSVDVLLHKKIVALCLYEHPTCTIDEMVGNLQKLYRNKQCDIYLCGDFNLNILNQTTTM